MALHRERRLPSSVRGPVLLSAFSRLASICLMVVILGQNDFLIVEILAVARRLALILDASVPKGSSQYRAGRFSGFATRPVRCPPGAVHGDDRGTMGPRIHHSP